MARSKTATPAPPVVLEQMRKALDRGWKAGLTVLTGEDAYHLDSAQRALIAGLIPEEETEYALTVYGEQKVDLSVVLGAVRSVGMFSPSRVVLVRELSALDGDPDILKEYAAHPPDNSYLIVRAPKLDLRRKLHQALAKSGTTLTFDPEAFDVRQLVAETDRLAEAKGLKLRQEAKAFLAEACAGDFYRIDAELEKMACWLGEEASGHEVGIEDLKLIATGGAILTGWEVANAILERDESAALTSVRELLDAGSEPLQILGGLAYRARSMLRAATMLKQRVPPRRVRQAANLWFVSEQAIGAMSRRYTMAELLRFPSMLLEADKTLKSRGIAPAAVLETLVQRMTRPAGEASR